MQFTRFIDFGRVDIAEMMAMNEAILKSEEGNTLFFWDPRKSIILGYFQKAEVELNLEYCKDYTITRRISGGGIAFSDNLGRQINYGAVATIDDDLFPLDIIESYKQICGVLIDTLKEYGLKASFRPINDVVVNGKKISGNAQTRREGKLLQNGTLLLDFDIDEMLRVIKIAQEKFKDKNISSLKEGITWMDKELGERKQISEIKKVIKKKYEERFGVKLIPSEPSEKEKKLAEQLIPKYRSREWVYNRIARRF